MIYTIGKTDVYTGAIAEHGRITKLGRCISDGKPYPGGCVWETFEAAQFVADNNPGFSVFGVDADWQNDTEPDEIESHHNLLRDAWIIPLEEES